jgi:hypothetical protein
MEQAASQIQDSSDLPLFSPLFIGQINPSLKRSQETWAYTDWLRPLAIVVRFGLDPWLKYTFLLGNVQAELLGLPKNLGFSLLLI